jgi:transitional endoplasmic reticulum ATPase
MIDLKKYMYKIILNVLRDWKGDFDDAYVFNRIVDDIPELHGDWTIDYREKEEDYLLNHQFANGKKFNFVPVNKILKKADINKMIYEIECSSPSLRDDFEISKQTDIIGDAFGLSRVERHVLETARIFGGHVPYQVMNLIMSFNKMERYDNPMKFISSIYNIPLREAKTLEKGFLLESGIVEQGPVYILPPQLNELFVEVNYKNSEQFIQKLFPSKNATDLTIDDYAHISKDTSRLVATINNSLTNRTKGSSMLLWGPPGTGKTQMALVLAKENNWDLKVIGDMGDDRGEKGRKDRLTSLNMAIRLYGASPNVVLLFDEMEDLVKEDKNASFSKAYINRLIETSTVPIIWTTNELMFFDQAMLRRMVYNIKMGIPPISARKKMWKKYATKYKLKLDDKTIEVLGETYDVAPAIIENAVVVASTALNKKERSNPEAIKEIIQNLDCLVCYGKKRQFATLKETQFYDLSCVNSDRDLTKFTSNLMDAPQDFSLLLYGPSGTGKSEYAKYLAQQLGKEVLFKKASDLLGPYLGETEMKIAEAFCEAREEGKFLIIDEGDSFLRDRKNVTHSWEISQVNQMLAEMENHSQPFAMTTNLKDDMDAASMRRFTFKMCFDFIKPEQSRKLFESYFGMDAPEDVIRLDQLTPGDFANVKKQTKALRITDRAEIIALLTAEVKEKGGRISRIGF